MNHHIAFGAVNQIETAVLSASPEPVTELDWIKNPHHARRAKFIDLSTPTVITGTHEAPEVGEYFALLGSNLKPEATIKLELFAESTDGEDLLQMEAQPVGMLLPLGIWRAGIDPYNVRSVERGERPLVLWFGQRIVYKAFRLTIEHGYVVEETAVYNDIPTQDEFGVISLEAEDGEITNQGPSQWVISVDASASGGSALHKTGGGFFPNAGEGPRFSFTFGATITGTHKVWVRAKTTGNDSFHVSVDGNATTVQHVPIDGAWHWMEAGTCVLTEDSDHVLEVSARENDLHIDKVVILPNADPAPTGTGPAASTYGVVGSTDSVEIRMLHMGSVWQPDRNFSYGATLSNMTDPELGQTTSGRSVQLRKQRESKTFAPPFDVMPDGDRFMLKEMERERAGRPVFISGYPGCKGWIADEHTFLARFQNALSFNHNSPNRHAVGPVFVEV